MEMEIEREVASLVYLLSRSPASEESDELVMLHIPKHAVGMHHLGSVTVHTRN